ncbi:hypothetical protein GGR58DRAFT_489139 [Xylaria digitata]|nr:hypothetical protein GGR58DRAFT_489139 [Xylaria digitata]
MRVGWVLFRTALTSYVVRSTSSYCRYQRRLSVSSGRISPRLPLACRYFFIFIISFSRERYPSQTTVNAHISL